MARNQEIRYTQPIVRAYRGNLSHFRYGLELVYDFLRRSPQGKPDVVSTIRQFAVAAGINVDAPLPATSAVVSNASAVPIGDATAVAAGQDNGTAAVAANAVTRVTLPGTDKIIKSTVKYTGPAITGTWVNGYTFTIVNGVITAIVAS